MKQLDRPRSGDRIKADDIGQLIDAVEELRNMPPGPGLGKTASGQLYVTRIASAESANSRSDTTGGIVLELHAAWDSASPYRIGERVTHKPTGAVYSYVYQANARPAGTDVPGTSGNWTKITDNKTIWTATSFAVNSVLMYGSAWQLYIYTANDSCIATDVPGVSAKWTKGAGVIFGISAYPPLDPADGITPVLAPFKEEYIYRETFDLTTHELMAYVRVKSYDIGGNLVAISGYVKRLTDLAVSHSGL